MSRVGLVAFCAISVLASAAAAQSTPGQINDPSTYKGSVAIQQEQQRQQQQQNQQFQQNLNNAPWNQSQPQQPSYGPSTGGGAQPQRLRVEDLPVLAPARNPLLGRWISRAPENPTDSILGGGGDLFGEETLNIARTLAGGILAGPCRQKFGLNSTIEFRADALLQIYSDGRERIVNRVSYRDHNGAVVMVPKEPGAPPFEFEFQNRNRVVMEGCPLDRSGPAIIATAPTAAPPGPLTSANARAPVASASAGQGSLSLAAGATGGQRGFYGMGGVPLFVVSTNPETALAQAGFKAPQGKSAFDGWMRACQTDRAACNNGLQAMVSSTVKSAKTDATGHAQVAPLPPGQYYVVGTASTGETGMFWHVPVVVKAGANTLTLDQRNGTLVQSD